MLTDILILFVVALAAGTFAFYVPRVNNGNYKLALVFAGAYLFAITIIHILPELFHQAVQPEYIGMFVLAGFFLQQGLEFLSTGVEHGHIHVHESGHQHRESSAILVLAALGIHSLLEGGLLAHPKTVEHHHDTNTLLWGILLHKAPEAFALMSILLCELKSKVRAFFYLTLFAAASPLGLYLNDFLLNTEALSPRAFTFLFALVSGNFLHISTTIVFESSLDHKFNARKTGVAVLASIVAVVAELVS